jgi:hypothetical protein
MSGEIMQCVCYQLAEHDQAAVPNLVSTPYATAPTPVFLQLRQLPPSSSIGLAGRHTPGTGRWSTFNRTPDTKALFKAWIRELDR